MVFKFKNGSHISGDAQRVGEELLRIRENKGHLRAVDVVDSARHQNSILHGYFQWDNVKAAEEWRLHEARHLIASVIVTDTEEHGELPNPMRAFVKIRTSEMDSYENVITAMSDQQLRERVLIQLLDEVARLRHKVENYEELADILSALDTVADIASRHVENGSAGAQTSTR